MAFGLVFQSQNYNLLINKHLLASFRSFATSAPTPVMERLAARQLPLPHGSISSGERKPKIDDLHNSPYYEDFRGFRTAGQSLLFLVRCRNSEIQGTP